MPSLDSWLEITIQAPVLLIPVLILVLIGLLVARIVAFRHWRAKLRRLSREVLDRRNQLAEQMEQKARETSAREAYRHFIYNVSHEVSNPLQSILTNLDNMASCTPAEAGRWQKYYKIIVAELQRVVRLTGNLRLLAHLETPGALMVREPVNLRGVAEDVIMAQHDAAEARGVRLRYIGPRRPAQVLGDRDRLRQVLMNLVDNGIKYSRPAGGEVIVNLQEKVERVWIHISDEGIGIPKEYLPHIFDTAYRAPDPRIFRRKGSGLGLAIVKRIVEQHGGEIRVRNRPDQGTSASFNLPLHALPQTIKRPKIAMNQQ